MTTKTMAKPPDPQPHWSEALVNEIQTKRLADHTAKAAAEDADRETRRAIVRGIGEWWPALVAEFRAAHEALRRVVPELRFADNIATGTVAMFVDEGTKLSIRVTADGWLILRDVINGTGGERVVDLVPVDGGLAPVPGELARTAIEAFARKLAAWASHRR